MKRIYLLPNLVTLANAFFGLLAMTKAVDALAAPDPALFYLRMDTACTLIFVAMVFDALGGKIAWITRNQNEFGVQLDSFADMLTFGVAPALLAKALIEHEGPMLGYVGHPRLHFLAAAAFALMAILRLARFNLETEPDIMARHEFRGLPSPAAAGALTSTIWLYLVLKSPEVIEVAEGTGTPVGLLMGWIEARDWAPVFSMLPVVLVILMIALALLMVSRVPYVHLLSTLARDRSQFFTLVGLVFGLFLFFLAPVPMLFLSFNGFVLWGLARVVQNRGRRTAPSEAVDPR